uniref:Uncharacterized protein n=1 Tax=Tetradesmus obliquus TaxID=3088 RepID=A0A383VVD8_TETOB|eukprot:jgi/Sobl393_1/7873/SZX68752.1
MSDSTTEAAELQQLAQGLAQLTHFALRYSSSAAADAAAAAWACKRLPLQDLQLIMEKGRDGWPHRLTAAVVQQIGSLQGLTKLILEGFIDQQACATHQQLCWALGRLTALRHLQLQDLQLATGITRSSSDAVFHHLDANDLEAAAAVAEAAAAARAAAGDAALVQLAGLQHLTHLLVNDLTHVYGTWQGLAELLSQMTAMEELTLGNIRLEHRVGSSSSSASASSSSSSSGGGRKGEGVEVLLAAVAQLTRLTQLSVIEMPVTAAAAAALARPPGARQLESLALVDCSLSVAAVQALASCCPLLRSLDLPLNKHVNDDALRSIGQQLQGLRHLGLQETGVTDAGVMSLSRLTTLTSIQLGEKSNVCEAARLLALRIPAWTIAATLEADAAAVAADTAAAEAAGARAERRCDLIWSLFFPPNEPVIGSSTGEVLLLKS